VGRDAEGVGGGDGPNDRVTDGPAKRAARRCGRGADAPVSPVSLGWRGTIDTGGSTCQLPERGALNRTVVMVCGVEDWRAVYASAWCRWLKL
jgi:hypothetical protein